MNNETPLFSKLDKIEASVGSTPFDSNKHHSESRFEITKLFLWWYFGLIAGSFLFCTFYNTGAALLNSYLKLVEPLKYLEISSVVSLITSTLSSGLGFVIGYYFKNKEDKE